MENRASSDVWPQDRTKLALMGMNKSLTLVSFLDFLVAHGYGIWDAMGAGCEMYQR